MVPKPSSTFCKVCEKSFIDYLNVRKFMSIAYKEWRSHSQTSKNLQKAKDELADNLLLNEAQEMEENWEPIVRRKEKKENSNVSSP